MTYDATRDDTSRNDRSIASDQESDAKTVRADNVETGDTTHTRRTRIVTEFDAAEADARDAQYTRPVATLTPAGQLHIVGAGDDEWLTTTYAIAAGDAR
ncbi:hypothetical protein [Salinilacihabitans rarus]|uniref:hypothetical protein n=1 Tax=Salinilacihabitans rarus TaxID=2961596 RepID=UPI0020C91740|nr:hypothetical protein [Salinilacihabitans rarus]